MRFEEAMNEVLETSRYDFLTGRRVDIREVLRELSARFANWLYENLNFNLPSGMGGNAGLIATIFTVVAVILVGIAAFVMIRAYIRSRKSKRHTLESLFEEIRNHTVAELLELSRASGNRRVAVRYKYIAALLWLNENDIIVIEPSATNSIILRQIKQAAPELAASFAQIAEAFHLTWFGHKNLSDESFSAFDTAVSLVVECKGLKLSHPAPK